MTVDPAATLPTPPLADIRIISLEQYGAGPFGTSHLANLGADVIKVEDPSSGGDIGRYIPPFQTGQDSLFYQTFNGNKRSIVLDLTNRAGRSIFDQLVARSDAVFSNLRGDVPSKLGITFEDLRPLNERIVCCSLSGFGMTGPRKGEPAYDYIIQGLTGWMSLTGEPDGPPTKTGLSLVDWCSGLVAAQAILAGVHAARRDGVGMDCDLSLFDTAINMLTYVATWTMSGEYTPGRRANSAHPSLVPFQNFETADGWIVVGCAKEKFWKRLTEAIERPELADDPRFVDFTARKHTEVELLPIVAEELRKRTTAVWLDRLGSLGVPCGPVNSVTEALSDPQTLARDLIVSTEHDVFGTVRQVASPVKLGTEWMPVHRRAPKLGEHTYEVIRDVLGITEPETAKLAAAGGFGRADPPTA